jgi:hypothetical protein
MTVQVVEVIHVAAHFPGRFLSAERAASIEVADIQA